MSTVLVSSLHSQFGGNPVACSIGQAVLDVIENEKLMSSAKNVGKCLKDGFNAIQPMHPMIGDVRCENIEDFFFFCLFKSFVNSPTLSFL